MSEHMRGLKQAKQCEILGQTEPKRSMAKQNPPPRPAVTGQTGSNKRKEPPTQIQNLRKENKRPRNDHRSKQRDARTLSVQVSSNAFKNGQLDVDNFVRSREYEIKALEAGMSRSKQALTKRAFQQVPKDLRRRTASHNVKRVPKRLQPRAKREMIEDNTPTVSSRTRKPTRHMRLRLETVKRLRALGAKRKSATQQSSDEKVTVQAVPVSDKNCPENESAIKARAPNVKKTKLANAPKPKAKFRKRQIDKTWLPSHIFHAKRARMTAPKEPLWRFAIPLTPTAKCYRPAHKSANERGAMAWDTSYTSTISMSGQQRSVEGVLKALHFHDSTSDHDLWTAKGEKWRAGLRSCTGMIFEREAPHRPIAPCTVIWSTSMNRIHPFSSEDASQQARRLFVRVHPAAFLQVWEEILRLAKVVKPQVSVEDLRYEIGSIEVVGPGATEALLGAIRPSPTTSSSRAETAKTWTALAGLTNLSLLPPHIILGMEIQDSRLYHPPRTTKIPRTSKEQHALLEVAAIWPLNQEHVCSTLFDGHVRRRASSALTTQKSINRRKAAAIPGTYPEPLTSDPSIPILVYSTSKGKGHDGSWIVLLPWKCVQPLWYSIMYYPLSTGGQPRFGGLDEKRQLAFETNQPWFPGDYVGTKSGWEWEIEQRQARKDAWLRKPKSKRVNWHAVKAGSGVKGELGLGWACDWERLISGPPDASTGKADATPLGEDSSHEARTSAGDKGAAEVTQANNTTTNTAEQRNSPSPTTFLEARNAEPIFQTATDSSIPTYLHNQTIIISLHCLTRGTPQTCARIYRLPTSAALRQKWLSLHPRNKPAPKGPKHSLLRLPKNAPAHLVQRQLAQRLISPARAGEEEYPECPGEEDLVGFVTTGNLNLAEGRGTGIGNLLFTKVLEDVTRHGQEDARLCIVRNAGQSIGRLARWSFAA